MSVIYAIVDVNVGKLPVFALSRLYSASDLRGGIGRPAGGQKVEWPGRAISPAQNWHLATHYGDLVAWNPNALPAPAPGILGERAALIEPGGLIWPIGLEGAASQRPSTGHLIPHALATCVVGNEAFPCGAASMHHANAVPTYQPWDRLIWTSREQELKELLDIQWHRDVVDRTRFRPEFWFAAGPAPVSVPANTHGSINVPPVTLAGFPPVAQGLVRWPAWVWGAVLLRVVSYPGELEHRKMAVAWRCDQIRDLRVAGRPLNYFPCSYTSVQALVDAGVRNPFVGREPWVIPDEAMQNVYWHSMLPRLDEQTAPLAIRNSKNGMFR